MTTPPLVRVPGTGPEECSISTRLVFFMPLFGASVASALTRYGGWLVSACRLSAVMAIYDTRSRWKVVLAGHAPCLRPHG